MLFYQLSLSLLQPLFRLHDPCGYSQPSMLNPGHPTQNARRGRLGWENMSSEGSGRVRRDSLLMFPLQKKPMSSTHTHLKQSREHCIFVAQKVLEDKRG